MESDADKNAQTMNPKYRSIQKSTDIFNRSSLNLSQSQTKRITNLNDNVETINLDEFYDCADDKECELKKNS